ncbi:hypothetical protein M427DRAFT_67497 [Gonapodya prolifera JEL478]|uniref:BZIP domain-containing protein n=1 Tax=Gonapodya prolifera (strain JEL478) TaxID=1344416 RepID=A0A139AQG5_GONPJ|nr:hypothetical protein M427DRAFT_67497 [Gonapodya prolifera JEL478]|eukprot:KXS18894.1 hypothetical protein M427DRAFT_67497 [Gonapodya prolifera JEL478]
MMPGSPTNHDGDSSAESSTDRAKALREKNKYAQKAWRAKKRREQDFLQSAFAQSQARLRELESENAALREENRLLNALREENRLLMAHVEQMKELIAFGPSHSPVSTPLPQSRVPSGGFQQSYTTSQAQLDAYPVTSSSPILQPYNNSQAQWDAYPVMSASPILNQSLVSSHSAPIVYFPPTLPDSPPPNSHSHTHSQAITQSVIPTNDTLIDWFQIQQMATKGFPLP